ncbi:hypothetical protein Lesp02_03700 [Lentzea sp. NBRC 105346]|uniref:DUF6355 family natural product biosynthesis protein n=1 Tax=Lentzea sp. NBRC 105346 TaxID=3032205 RepID=UPI0024A36C3D|nr:DUF6355 family natural product biosynthesis protein [Lentzea sp. NBRC 105346]GLZ28180.1 hypothetical protein Lesp02_03700 [Lentzea sp. NBRC 105346]
MNRKIVGRFAASLAVATAMLGGGFAGSAHAQVGAPWTVNAGSSASNIQLNAWAGVTTRAPAASNELSATGQCGFYRDSRDAWYRHCGGGMLIIKVRSWWGAEVRELCVWPGDTNLSQHDGTKGMGYITYAWADRPGC